MSSALARMAGSGGNRLGGSSTIALLPRQSLVGSNKDPDASGDSMVLDGQQFALTTRAPMSESERRSIAAVSAAMEQLSSMHVKAADVASIRMNGAANVSITGMLVAFHKPKTSDKTLLVTIALSTGDLTTSVSDSHGSKQRVVPYANGTMAMTIFQRIKMSDSDKRASVQAKKVGTKADYHYVPHGVAILCPGSLITVLITQPGITDLRHNGQVLSKGATITLTNVSCTPSDDGKYGPYTLWAGGYEVVKDPPNAEALFEQRLRVNYNVHDLWADAPKMRMREWPQGLYHEIETIFDDAKQQAAAAVAAAANATNGAAASNGGGVASSVRTTKTADVTIELMDDSNNEMIVSTSKALVPATQKPAASAAAAATGAAASAAPIVPRFEVPATDLPMWFASARDIVVHVNTNQEEQRALCVKSWQPVHTFFGASIVNVAEDKDFVSEGGANKQKIAVARFDVPLFQTHGPNTPTNCAIISLRATTPLVSQLTGIADFEPMSELSRYVLHSWSGPLLINIEGVGANRELPGLGEVKALNGWVSTASMPGVIRAIQNAGFEISGVDVLCTMMVRCWRSIVDKTLDAERVATERAAKANPLNMLIGSRPLIVNIMQHQKFSFFDEDTLEEIAECGDDYDKMIALTDSATGGPVDLVKSGTYRFFAVIPVIKSESLREYELQCATDDHETLLDNNYQFVISRESNNLPQCYADTFRSMGKGASMHIFAIKMDAGRNAPKRDLATAAATDAPAPATTSVATPPAPVTDAPGSPAKAPTTAAAAATTKKTGDKQSQHKDKKQKKSAKKKKHSHRRTDDSDAEDNDEDASSTVVVAQDE